MTASVTAELRTPRLLLRTPALTDAFALAAYLARNADHFAATDPPRRAGYDTAVVQAEQIALALEQQAAGRRVSWLLCPTHAPAEVIGRINLTEIVRGPFHNAYLGYQIDRAHQGRGLMHEALDAATAHAFAVIGLHRIEANHLPDNARSAALLARLGFERIGIARNYLFIAGAWRDHVLNQKLNPDFDVGVFVGDATDRR